MSKKKSSLSGHALIRLKQRTSLSDAEVSQIFDKRLTVLVEKIPGFTKEYHLFYSEEDDCFFVAIRDITAGVTISIWPLGYCTQLLRPIKPEECEIAKKLFLDYQAIAKSNLNVSIQHIRLDNKTIPDLPPVKERLDDSVFTIAGLFIDEEDRPKIKRIGKVMSKPYNHDVQRLILHKDFINNMELAAKEVGIPIGYLYEVKISQSRSGPYYYKQIRDPNKIVSKS